MVDMRNDAEIADLVLIIHSLLTGSRKERKFNTNPLLLAMSWVECDKNQPLIRDAVGAFAVNSWHVNEDPSAGLWPG